MSVYRKPHKLKTIKTTTYPYHFIFVDTETMPVACPGYYEHLFKLGWACYWRRSKPKQSELIEWFSFTKTAEFWGWLFTKVEKKSRLILISHNVAFDMTVLCPWQIMAEKGYKLKTLIIDHDVNILRYKSADHTIMIIDNVNFFKHSLSDLGRMVGLVKLAVDFDTATDEELSVYCKRDVEILLKTWQHLSDFILEEDLGGFTTTVASLAFRSFEHRFMTHDIFIHTLPEVVDLERRSYHGGRTEVFRLGDLSGEDWYVLDVNSMYPAVMLNNDYPVKLLGHGASLSLTRLPELLHRHLIVADVVLNTERPAFPLELDGHLIFPTGRFKTTLCMPELLVALRYGVIEEIGEWAIYGHAPIFNKYVQYWWNKKSKAEQAGDRVMRLFYKLMLNSLYGKFAQRNRIYEYLYDDPSFDFARIRAINSDRGIDRWLVFFGGAVFEEKERTEGFDSFVAIASHVTSYARVFLWHAIVEAGLENVVYMDTDSLFVNKKGLERLMARGSEGALGSWALKGQSSNLVVMGVKDYILNDERILKGIKKTAREIELGVFEQEQWPSFRGMLLEGQANKYRTKFVRKVLSREYFKGLVLTGGRVTPITLMYRDGKNLLDGQFLDSLRETITNREVLQRHYD